MITQIKIKNFQSHKGTVLDLSKGVNIILGSSDSGKSAIIRAIRWVIYGKPKGDHFRSTWGGDTSVEIVRDRKYSVEKIKSNSETLHKIKVGSDCRVFKLAETPDEMYSILNFNEINLQNQADPYFLLNNTSGEVAAHFNKVANLEQIDDSLRQLQSLINQKEREISFKEGAYQEAKITLKTFNFISELEQGLIFLEGLSEKTEKKNLLKRTLQTILHNINEIDSEITNKSPLLLADKLLHGILLLFEKKDALKRQISMITDLVDDVVNITAKIKAGQNYIQAGELVENLIETYNNKKEITKKSSNLYNILNALDINQTAINRINQDIENTTANFEKNMPKICPLCGK